MKRREFVKAGAAGATVAASSARRAGVDRERRINDAAARAARFALADRPGLDNAAGPVSARTAVATSTRIAIAAIAALSAGTARSQYGSSTVKRATGSATCKQDGATKACAAIPSVTAKIIGDANPAVTAISVGGYGRAT